MQCAFVGAGAVAGKYAAGLSDSPIELTAVSDLAIDRAERLADEHDATPYRDVASLLDAERVPLVVNLTSHAAHADVTETALKAGRHVFSEKPLALDADRAAALAETASERNLALGCAPINHRCDAQRHARSFLRDGRFGRISLGYAHAHVGRVTEWHDSPSSFLSVGPLYDGAVYPLTLLVEWFGPVERVRMADALDVWPDRMEREPDRPAHVEATIEFASGPIVRLTASLYAPHRSREFYSLELHGDDGSLYFDDTGALAADPDTVSVGGAGRQYVSAPHPYPRREYSHLAGPERLAAAIDHGRRPTRGARRAAHVVAVCNAIDRAAADGTVAEVSGTNRDGWATAAGASGEFALHPRQQAASFVDDDADDPMRDGALRLPPVGFGCSRYRGGEYVDRIDSIATALDAGYRLLDSAELYGNEARLGDLLNAPGSPDRDGLFLASKVWNTNHQHVAEACEGTLAELGVDTLDAYLLHWPDAWRYQGPLTELAELPPDEQEALAFPTDDASDPDTVDVPLTETWRRMEAIHDRGLTRTLGVCNVSLAQLHEIIDVAEVPPAIVQIESHPYRPRNDLIEACHTRGIRVLAHSPLSAPGLLEEPVLTEVAAEHDVSPAAVAIAYHVDRGVVPIPSSNDPDHVVDNLAAARLQLTESDRDRLSALAGTEFQR
ncbi:MAG: aldo/keto reductase [Halobellus sp.]|uniref:aldo/keto reductase n=1 Tax=Halobellus sp. TaxID=1979212 RepID=UPI0035D4CED5